MTKLSLVVNAVLLIRGHRVRMRHPPPLPREDYRPPFMCRPNW
jgi:hypothetical protein